MTAMAAFGGSGAAAWHDRALTALSDPRRLSGPRQDPGRAADIWPIGTPPTFAKTASVHAWAQELHAQATTAELDVDLRYWPHGSPD